MITTTAYSLRTIGDWLPVDPRRLLRQAKEDNRCGDDKWKVAPWQRNNYGSGPFRTYIVMSEGGGLYMLHLRRVD